MTLIACTRYLISSHNALTVFWLDRYTKTKISSTTAVYAIVLDWPTNGKLQLGAPKMDSSGVVYLLGYRQQVKFSPGGQGGITIMLPEFADGTMPCKHAWVFRMLGVKN